MARYLVTTRSRSDDRAPQHLCLLDGALSDADVQRLAGELLHDPVVQTAAWESLDDLSPSPPAVEVAYRPGVADTEAESIAIGARRLGIAGLRAVRTLRRYMHPDADPAALAELYNPLIQMMFVQRAGEIGQSDRLAFYALLLHPPDERAPLIEQVALREANDDELLRISQAGILALDLAEMHAIRDYFRSEGRDPTDGELETLAQTWSEHCSHKTFKALVRYVDQGSTRRAAPRASGAPTRYAALELLEGGCEIDSLMRTFLIAATDTVLKRRQNERIAPDERLTVLSAFVDNAGIIAFGAHHQIAIKVETHNHPSALEPFGGANTGVGGVVRDILGVSARPIANTDVLCFGPLDLPAADLSAGVLHPRRVAAGVVAGIRDYGNKLGIPTVNGAALYDHGYIANPLVFCGTIGIAPRDRHPHNPRPGDAIVSLGGRTGRDGIHGATFSSAELTHTTAQEVGSAVQIGDPITEKKLLDVLIQARDAGLYSAITDCGAGGLSSAVGEMGEQTGAAVELADVPLKYAGLQPWEIWLSEAQERMVLAVPPAKLDMLLALCAGEDVEATMIGHFTGNGRLTVTYRGAMLVDVSMAFLHQGRPQRALDALWRPVERADGGERRQEDRRAEAPSLLTALLQLLAHPNIASKAPIVRTYDHEVLGQTVVKPLVGAACDGPSDAAVLQPLRTTMMGLAIGCGINPRYGRIDPYWMALACIDEALRNVVAVGGDPQQTVILDNFCWGDPRRPDQMAGLARAAAGCHDAAIAFGTPFVSGKDSLNNEYRDASGASAPIPPTLLITALAIVPDVRRAVTMDLKTPGDLVYLVGTTRDELGGAYMHALRAPPRQPEMPKVDLALAPQIMTAMQRAIGGGLVRACHDLSEGGLGVALAEMSFAGGYGLRADLRAITRDPGLEDDWTLLFSESTSRFLAEVHPNDAGAFELLFAGLPCAPIGEVVVDAELIVVGVAGAEALRGRLDELKAAWQGTAVV